MGTGRAARAVFKKQFAALPADQRERLALLAFGAGGQIGDVGVGDVAGNDVCKGTDGRTDVSGMVYGAAVGTNLGSITITPGGPSPSPASGTSSQASPARSPPSASAWRPTAPRWPRCSLSRRCSAAPTPRPPSLTASARPAPASPPARPPCAAGV
ncbi:hypothetical protein EKD04_017255 [Chloroflexales bacterium ZM16-3]|nr:hypothetical protein [Chloroflexales bacterium ZM16-3]